MPSSELQSLNCLALGTHGSIMRCKGLIGSWGIIWVWGWLLSTSLFRVLCVGHTSAGVSFRAMASPASRDQFLRQMEQIVEGIKQSRMKVRWLLFCSRPRSHTGGGEGLGKSRLLLVVLEMCSQSCRHILSVSAEGPLCLWPCGEQGQLQGLLVQRQLLAIAPMDWTPSVCKHCTNPPKSPQVNSVTPVSQMRKLTHQQASSPTQNHFPGSLVPDILPLKIHFLASQEHFSFQEPPCKNCKLLNRILLRWEDIQPQKSGKRRTRKE